MAVQSDGVASEHILPDQSVNKVGSQLCILHPCPQLLIKKLYSFD